MPLEPELRMRPPARDETTPAGEEEWIARARGGDAGAFGELVRGHYRRVFGVLFRLVGSPEDAEDLAQETFVRAHRSLHHLREPAGLGPWLLRIAVHLARDHQRAQGRRGTQVQLSDELRAASARKGPSGAAGELDARELRARLDAALEELPERQRTAFVLRALEGLDYETIGPALGVTPKSARNLVSKARRALVRRLGPWVEGGTR